MTKETNPDKLLDDPSMNLAKKVKESVQMTVVVTIYIGLVSGFTITFLPGYLRELNAEDPDVTFVQSLFIAAKSLGAIIGGITFGYLSSKYSIKLLIVYSNFISIISVFLFGYANLLPTNLRFPWVVFLSFCMGTSVGVIALIRTYASLVITYAEIRIKFLTYISAVGGVGGMMSNVLIWLSGFLSVSNSYSHKSPIFDTYTSVIFTVSILGFVVAFLAYYTVLDLHEVKEIQKQHLSELKASENQYSTSSSEKYTKNHDAVVHKKSLRRALSRPEVKNRYSNRVTYISWFGALIMCFIWLLDILIGPASNLSNVYSAEFNYSSTKATSSANKHLLRGSGLGVIGYATAIVISQEIEPHILLLIIFIINLLNYVFILPVFGSTYLVQQEDYLDFGCVYSWCNSEKALRQWQLTVWGLIYSFVSAFIGVAVTAAHGVIVSIQGNHAIHQTIFTVFGFLGTLLNPLFVLNVFSFAGMLWLTSIEMAFLALTVGLLIVYMCLYDLIEEKVKCKTGNDILPVDHRDKNGESSPQHLEHQF